MNNLNIIGLDLLDENLDENININKLSADLPHASVQFDR